MAEPAGPSTPGQLAGRRILVTGAATGIGAAAVEVFAAEGATLTATYHQTPPPERLTSLADWVQCDFRQEAQANRTVQAAAAAMGGLDVLLHAAGTWRAGAAGQLSEEDLDFMLATNVKATVFANQAAFHVMADDGGHIINLGSSEGVTGVPYASSYSLAKGAVHSWTRSAARAWGQHGITVNALAPAVETPGADRFREFIGPEGAASLNERIAESTPIASSLGKGLGDPIRDLGPMMVFLASVGSRYVTGQLLAVSGGGMMLGA
ncbi:MAG: family NAD(P)-dependent oxidoreductase [Frankiales bacterium]|nr:family NAD(P)-dependent oxidoreductase [Frankiales bacterium]